MSMKIKSGMIRTDKYVYRLSGAVDQIYFAKGRPDGVLELVWLTVYNATANEQAHLYFLLRYQGQVIRLFYDAAVAAVDVDYRCYPVFLHEGCELGIEIDGHTAGDVIEIGAQWIFHIDKDYNQPT